MKIGFVGIGNIGAPIAGQLLRAGHFAGDLRRQAGGFAMMRQGLWRLGESRENIAQSQFRYGEIVGAA